MRGCPQLSRLPRKDNLKSVNFKRVTPGSPAAWLGAPQTTGFVDPTHPLARRGSGLMRYAPNIETEAFQLKAIPKACLFLPEETNSPHGSQFAPLKWPGDRRINMSILNLAFKSKIHKGAYIRRTVSRRVHCAFALIITRGADCGRDRKGRDIMTFKEEDIGSYWVSQEWTYLLWPKLEAFKMPWPQLVQCGRTALNSISQQILHFNTRFLGKNASQPLRSKHPVTPRTQPRQTSGNSSAHIHVQKSRSLPSASTAAASAHPSPKPHAPPPAPSNLARRSSSSTRPGRSQSSSSSQPSSSNNLLFRTPMLKLARNVPRGNEANRGSRRSYVGAARRRVEYRQVKRLEDEGLEYCPSVLSPLALSKQPEILEDWAHDQPEMNGGSYYAPEFEREVLKTENLGLDFLYPYRAKGSTWTSGPSFSDQLATPQQGAHTATMLQHEAIEDEARARSWHGHWGTVETYMRRMEVEDAVLDIRLHVRKFRHRVTLLRTNLTAQDVRSLPLARLGDYYGLICRLRVDALILSGQISKLRRNHFSPDSDISLPWQLRWELARKLFQIREGRLVLYRFTVLIRSSLERVPAETSVFEKLRRNLQSHESELEDLDEEELEYQDAETPLPASYGSQESVARGERRNTLDSREAVKLGRPAGRTGLVSRRVRFGRVARAFHTSAISSSKAGDKAQTTAQDSTSQLSVETAPQENDVPTHAAYQTALKEVLSARLWAERPTSIHPVQLEDEPETPAAKVESSKRWVEDATFVRALIQEVDEREKGTREAQKRVLQKLGFRVKDSAETGPGLEESVSGDATRPAPTQSKGAKKKPLSLEDLEVPSKVSREKARKRPALELESRKSDKADVVVDPAAKSKHVAQSESVLRLQDEVLRDIGETMKRLDEGFRSDSGPDTEAAEEEIRRLMVSIDELSEEVQLWESSLERSPGSHIPQKNHNANTRVVAEKLRDKTRQLRKAVDDLHSQLPLWPLRWKLEKHDRELADLELRLEEHIRNMGPLEVKKQGPKSAQQPSVPFPTATRPPPLSTSTSQTRSLLSRNVSNLKQTDGRDRRSICTSSRPFSSTACRYPRHMRTVGRRTPSPENIEGKQVRFGRPSKSSGESLSTKDQVLFDHLYKMALNEETRPRASRGTKDDDPWDFLFKELSPEQMDFSQAVTGSPSHTEKLDSEEPKNKDSSILTAEPTPYEGKPGPRVDHDLDKEMEKLLRFDAFEEIQGEDTARDSSRPHADGPPRYVPHDTLRSRNPGMAGHRKPSPAFDSTRSSGASWKSKRKDAQKPNTVSTPQWPKKDYHPPVTTQRSSATEASGPAVSSASLSRASSPPQGSSRETGTSRVSPLSKLWRSKPVLRVTPSPPGKKP